MFVDGAHRDMLQYGLSRAAWRHRDDGPDAGAAADDSDGHED
jgi:hypothetical protein